MAKVVRFHELGGPEVLRLEEITFEDPAPGELRLKVGAIRTQPAGSRLSRTRRKRASSLKAAKPPAN